jgi:hypothetical protein
VTRKTGEKVAVIVARRAAIKTVWGKAREAV